MKAIFLTESNAGKSKNHLYGAGGQVELGQSHAHHVYIGVICNRVGKSRQNGQQADGTFWYFMHFSEHTWNNPACGHQFSSLSMDHGSYQEIEIRTT